MRDAFRSWGHEADVWAPDIDDDLAGDGRPYAEFASAGAGRGRRRHPPLRAALAHERGPARLPGPTSAPPPQHHAPGVLRPVGPGDGPHLRARPRAGRRACGATSTSPSPTASSAGGSSRRRGSRGRASSRSSSTSRATASRRAPCSSASSTTSAPTSSSWGASPRTSGRRTSSASPRSGSASSRRPCAWSSWAASRAARRARAFPCGRTTSTRSRPSPTRRG